MKNRFFLFLASLLFIGVSCTPEETPEAPVAPSLEVFPGAVSFTFQGGTKTLTVDCSVEGWTVESDQAWLEAVKTNETTVTLTAGELKEGDATPEAAVVTVTAGEGDAQTTKEIPVSQKPFVAELVFEGEFANTSYTGTDFTVTPSDETASYCVVPVYACDFGDYSAAELLSYIEERADQLDLNNSTYTGVQTINVEDLFPGTDYIQVVFGWDDNAHTSDAFLFDFSTEATTVDPADVEIVLTPSNVTAKSADVTVDISDPNALYVTIPVPMDIVSDIDKADYQAAIDKVSANLYKGVASVGNKTIPQTGLSSSTDYAMAVALVDGEGTIRGEVYVEEDLFQTEEMVVAEGYEAWLGTWTVTSTTSMLAEKPITFEIVIKEGENVGEEYYVYGFEPSGNRWGVPTVALLNEVEPETQGSIQFVPVVELGQDKEGYNVSQVALSYISDPTNDYAMISGLKVAFGGFLGEDGQTAEIYGAMGSVTGGAEFTVAGYNLLAEKDGKYYNYTSDPALGVETGELFVGPYDLVKKSDSTDLPTGAPAKALSVASSSYSFAKYGVATANEVNVPFRAYDVEKVLNVSFAGVSTLNVL